MAQNTRILSVNEGVGDIVCCVRTNFYCQSDEDAEIMRWLSPLEPTHKHLRTDRFDGVGDWFLETSEFREWRSSEGGFGNAVLFCSGNPGVGKTYLSSLVIDSLSTQAWREDIAVAGLYCDFHIQQEQTVASIMGAILKQLVGRGDIPEHLREAFQGGKRKLGGRRPRLPDLMGMLRITLASLPQVFICIDALDECLPKHLPELLGSLRDIVRESPQTRIFLTGRPHITEDTQRYFAKAVVMRISPNTDDIRSYLEMRLDRDPEPQAMDDGLRADILRVILERESDIFLLVSLHIDAILGEVTIHQRRKKLEEMTQCNGLSDAYTETLTRLKAQPGNKSMLGLKVLMWVLYSERPLRVGELCHALGVVLRSADLDRGNVPALRTLLVSSLGLVTIEASSSTVRLVHSTLREHLLNDPTPFHSPHSAISEVCLTYLNFGCVRDLSPTLPSAPATMLLLEYASHYWGEHARKAMTENVKTLALKLLSKYDEHISAQLVLLNYKEGRVPGPYFDGERGSSGFTGLHGAAFFGIVEVFEAVLEMRELDVNARDSEGCTPLIWAAVRGHGEVVKMLLGRGDVNPNLGDSRWNQTPLLWAAQEGHEGVVKAFLQHEDVNPNLTSTRDGRTPLSYAAKNGHEEITEMLLERNDIHIELRDNENQTPLSLALSQGHDKVARMISERAGTKSNTTGPINQASLLPSTGDGEGPVAEIPLGGDHPNIDTVDPSGKPTPPPQDPNTSEGVSDCTGTISNSPDSTIPSTEPPSCPRPLRPLHLRFWHSLRKIATGPKTPPAPRP